MVLVLSSRGHGGEHRADCEARAACSQLNRPGDPVLDGFAQRAEFYERWPGWRFPKVNESHDSTRKLRMHEVRQV